MHFEYLVLIGTVAYNTVGIFELINYAGRTQKQVIIWKIIFSIISLFMVTYFLYKLFS